MDCHEYNCFACTEVVELMNQAELLNQAELIW